MNGTWHITPMMLVSLPIQTPQLAQVSVPAQPGVAIENGVNNSVNYLQGLIQNLVLFIPNLLAALAILLVGLLVAAIVSAIVRGVLNRTSVDNRLANWLTGRPADATSPPVEKWISAAVFWLIMIFVIVAVLNSLNLTTVSAPLNTFLTQVTSFLPKLLGAAILLGVAWAIATVVKLITTRGLRAARFDERVNQQPAGTPRDPNQLSLAETIGSALYWFIFLLFLLPVLNTLGLDQALQPVQSLITQILSILPNILAAVLIAAVGWFVAQIVRRIVTNLLATTGIDRAGTQFGLRQTRGGQSLSGIIGTIVYVLILIPVAIAALQALRIDAISVPAIAMLNQILNALPAIFTAALILIVAYFLGRFVADFSHQYPHQP